MKLGMIVALGLLSAPPVLAQSLSTTTYGTNAKGKGVKLSQENGTILHVGVDAGVGINTNPYSETDAVRAGKPNTLDVIFRIRPLFYLSAKGKKLELEIGMGGDLGGLAGIPGTGADFLLFNGNAYGKGEFNKDGVISLFARGDFATSRQVTEVFVGTLTNLRGDAVVGTTIRPGGGALALTLDGQIAISGYSGLTTPGVGTDTTSVIALNNQSFYGHARIGWNFLPQTSVYVDGKYGAWVNSVATAQNLTVNPLWVGAGLTGDISERVSMTFAAGYANAFITQQTVLPIESTSLPVSGMAEAAWDIAEGSRLVLGARRDMSLVPTFIDMYTNQVYIKYDQRFFKKVLLSLYPQFNMYEYGKPYAAIGATTNARSDTTLKHRSDLSLDMRADVTYFIRDWFGVGIAGQGSMRWTTANPLNILTLTAQVAAPNDNTFKPLFNRFEAVAFVSFNY
jgi:hypothetical protein